MKQKDFLAILVPTFIVTILWVIFSIYHNLTTSTIIDPLTIQIIPLSGTFDHKAIQSIKDRQRFDPLFELEGTAGVSIVPTASPTPSPTLEATPSAIPTMETPSPTGEIIP